VVSAELGRWFRLALRTWPEGERARCAEAAATFEARVLERRTSGRATRAFIVRELIGVLLAGIHMRRHARSSRPTNRSALSMDTLLQDVRFAARAMLRNPGFAAVVVLVLALGIGANTAIFSVLSTTLLRPLPVASPDRLVTIRESNPEKDWDQVVAAPANMLDWRERVDAFEDVGGHISFGGATLTGDGEPEILRSTTVTGNFFDVLGVRAALGRTFRDAETWNTEPPVVLLSDGFWARRYARDPAIIGRKILLDGEAHEVVGVMAPGFSFPAHEMDVWSPVRFNPANRDAVGFRRAHYVDVIARLKPGVTLHQADAQLQAVVRQLQVEYPVTNRVMGAGIYPLQEFLTGDVRTPLLLVQGAVLLLLLVACANVGNLLLVRSVARRREMAVRAALGAGRLRIAAQVMTESLTLALLGGLAGVLVGTGAIRALASLLPEGLPPIDGLGLDGRVLTFAAAITVLAGIVFGLVPALRGPIDLNESLRDGGRGGTSGRKSLRMANLLVVSEIAVALVLVLGAGLLVRSFAALRDVDPGFQIEDRVTARVTLPGSRYDTVDKVSVFFDALRERLEALPGVRGVTLARTVPLAGTSYTSDFVARGWAPDEFGAEVTNQSVAPSYLETLGMPLLSGRFLEETDRTAAEPVVVINDALAKRHFPGEDPVGRMIAFDRQPTEITTWWRIVGVIGDQHQSGVGEAPRTEVYYTYWQNATSSLVAVIHSTQPTAEVVAGLRDAVRGLDADIPLAQVQTLSEIYAVSLRSERFLLVLIALFAALALLLAALGIYGVASQAARRRTQEIGLRVALGARRGDVARLILGQSLRLVGAGVVVGVIGGFAVTRVMTSVLYDVPPNDPITFVTVPFVLAVVALIATWLPARSATRVDPLVALRAE
jgi:putative ABC transport system permease protein